MKSRSSSAPTPETQAAASTESDAIAVRPARDHDHDAVLALLTAAQLPLGGVAERFPVGYVVASTGERVVGVAAVERYGHGGLLRSVAVVAELRSTGLGARLVGEALTTAAAEGLDDVYLLTTTAPAFFRKLGFREVDRASAPAPVRASEEFASICPASATCMARRLGGPNAQTA